MSDSFEFTLHSPLTKEDWNKILDAEHERTNFVTFQTPQGRQVKYIKSEVLDKLRAEIENHCGLAKEIHCMDCPFCNSVMEAREILEIIDKYKAERSEA